VEAETLSLAVTKICDGRTQMDFMLELGLFRPTKEPGGDSVWAAWVKDHHPELVDSYTGEGPGRKYCQKFQRAVYAEFEAWWAANHQPDPGAQERLAAEFGVHWIVDMERLVNDPLLLIVPPQHLKEMLKRVLTVGDKLRALIQAG
jgi:hypothetical protein